MKIRNILALGLSLLLTNLLHAHDEAFKPDFVSGLVPGYLSIEKGLAADDLPAAQKGAQSFLAAMDQAPEGSKRIERTDENLSTPAKAIAEAKDLAAAREAFQSLSDKMEGLVTHVGVTGDTSLYLLHCPMALGGKGANWIQDDKSVTNPYFGKKMLRCGSVQKQIAGEASDKA
jgi:Cu(I)/Ag(I) efflux system membrane fusion protein